MKKSIVATTTLALSIFVSMMCFAAIVYLSTFSNVAHAQSTWTLTVNSAHDSPSPPVGPNMYNDGDPVTCTVSSPVVEGGRSYTCTGWSGTGDFASGGSGTTAGPFTMTQNSSITWQWELTPRTLTVASAHDSPSPGVGPHTYDDGDPVTCSVTSPVTEGSTVWTCTGWIGTGSVTSGSGSSTSFTITQDSSITWSWQGAPVQRTLTVSSGHDSPNPSNGPHVYDDGSSVTCSVTSPVTEGSTVWTCTGWIGTGSVTSGSGSSTSFTITQDSSITWSWQGAPVQRTLTVSSGHDSPNPSNGPHVYDDGSSVTCSVTSPVTEGSTVWTCTGWTGTGSVPPSGSGTSTGSFIITSDSSITWSWQGAPVQRTLTVSSGHDSPNPSNGPHVYDDGSSVTCSVTSPVTEGGITYVCTGWSGTGSVPLSGSGTSTGSFTITQDSSIIWNWAPIKRLLTVVSSHDSPSPGVGNHFYDDGSSVTCSVTSPVTEGGVAYVCTGWTGTGSVPSTGSGASVTFTISQNSTITWNWQVVQRTLTVSSAHDSPSPSNGPHVYADGSSVTCSVSSPVTEGSTIWSCTGWSGTGSVPSSGSGSSVTFTISQDSTVTWNWHGSTVQRTLTVSSAHDSPSPSNGPHVYADGSSVTCSVSSPVTEGNVVWTCIGWTGTGSVPSSGSGSSTGSFTITSDSSITWSWQGVLVQRTLTVSSAHDSPSPSNGPHVYADGSSVTCSVSSPVTEGNVVWTCTGWTGTGSVPSSGSGSSTGSFTITSDSSITWSWQGVLVQRTLTVSSAHDSPSPSNGPHVYADGSSVTCSVSSPVSENGTVWTCTGWSGTGSVPSSGSGSSVTFTISQDSTITWNWHGNAVQRTLTVSSAHDSPSPVMVRSCVR